MVYINDFKNRQISLDVDESLALEMALFNKFTLLKNFVDAYFSTIGAPIEQTGSYDKMISALTYNSHVELFELTTKFSKNTVLDFAKEYLKLYKENDTSEKESSQNDSILNKIDMSLFKSREDVSEEEFKNEIKSIWEHIECNFDKKIEKAIVEEDFSVKFIMHGLDDSQVERLNDYFTSIYLTESFSDYTVISLDM